MSIRQIAEKVSVVITHYKALDELAECLRTIADHPGSEHLEVVVADSEAGAEEAAAVVAENLPTARYLPFAANCGYAALVNAGLAVTDRPYTLILNADIQVPELLIPTLVDFLEQNTDVGMVGPAVCGRDGEHQTTAFRFYRPTTIVYRRTPLGQKTAMGRAELRRFQMAEEVAAAEQHGTPMESDWLMGAAVMVRRDAVRAVGPMDESYFLYFEDVDWCLHFWRSGWRVVHLPTVQVRHLWSRASAKGGVAALLVNPLARRHLKSAAKFFSRYGLSVKRPVIRTAPAPVPAGPRSGSIPAQRTSAGAVASKVAS
jgi:N-acetylglucosaminyl-diphospho-decaprenol L-rhamnosyltransferase